VTSPIIIGNATLYLGDCIDVMPQLAEVDHVFTDPPYGQHVYDRLNAPNSKSGSGTRIRLTGNDKKTIGQSTKDLAAGAIGSIDSILEASAQEIARLSRRWSVVFSDLESCHAWRDMLTKAGTRYVRTGAWVKPDAMPQFSGDRPAVGFEPCTIVHAQGPMRWNGGGSAAVWTFNTVKGTALDRPDHPCPKPIQLMKRLVDLFSDTGEAILDPFMGSGTTGVAAVQRGRKFIGIERDPKYFADTCKRIEDAQRQGNLFSESAAA
jgi:DNA modification methylase